MKTVSIIGAGLGGLASAIRLAKNGFKVSVYEKRPYSGGRMDAITIKGINFDTGPTILIMTHTLKELFQFAHEQMDSYFILKKIYPNYIIFPSDKTSFKFSTALSEMKNQLDKIENGAAKRYQHFLDDASKVNRIIWEDFLGKNFNSLSDLLRWRTIMVFFKGWTLESIFSITSKYFKSEKLRYIFSFQSLYLGESPHRCPGTMAVIPYSEAANGIWFPIGGMKKISDGLEKIARKLDVSFHFNSSVEKIIVKKGVVKGIKTRGRIIASDIVLCNSDLPYTYTRLIKPKYNRKAVNKIKKYKSGCSAFAILAVVKKDYKHLSHHNMFFPQNFRQLLNDIFMEKIPPKDPLIYVCIPSRTDPNLAKGNLYGMYILTPVPSGSRYNLGDKKEAYKKIILNALESRGLENLTESIVDSRILTPKDYGTRYNLYGNAAFGFAPTLFQSGYFRPHNKADIKNLYFVGANTHPFSGIPTVLKSAELVTEQILKDQKL